MLPLYRHAPDGLFSLIHSCRVQTGSEVLRVIISPRSTSTKSIGWGNLPKTLLKAVQCYLKESKRKSKPLLIPYLPELLLRRLAATPSNWELKLLTTILSSSYIWWLSSPILISVPKLLLNAQSSTLLSQRADCKISYSQWLWTLRRMNSKLRNNNWWKSRMILKSFWINLSPVCWSNFQRQILQPFSKIKNSLTT